MLLCGNSYLYILSYWLIYCLGEGPEGCKGGERPDHGGGRRAPGSQERALRPAGREPSRPKQKVKEKEINQLLCLYLLLNRELLNGLNKI